MLSSRNFEDAPDNGAYVDFSSTLGATGIHHVIDNATDGLKDVISDFADNVHKATEFCRLLRRRDTRFKLLERCFNSPLGRNFHELLRSFRGWIHQGRWGTLAFSAPEILRIKNAFRWGWSKAVYLRGFDANNVAAHQQATFEQMTVMIDCVDEAVNDEAWWGWLLTMDKLFGLLRRVTAWVDGCSCHSSLLDEHGGRMPPALKAAWSACPMRCRRAPELANGDLLAVVAAYAHASCVDLVVELPNVLTVAQRAHMLDIFDQGRAHLQYYLTSKLSYWAEFPWLVCRAAHQDVDIGKATVRQALESRQQHAFLYSMKQNV